MPGRTNNQVNCGYCVNNHTFVLITRFVVQKAVVFCDVFLAAKGYIHFGQSLSEENARWSELSAIRQTWYLRGALHHKRLVIFYPFCLFTHKFLSNGTIYGYGRAQKRYVSEKRQFRGNFGKLSNLSINSSFSTFFNPWYSSHRFGSSMVWPSNNFAPGMSSSCKTVLFIAAQTTTNLSYAFLTKKFQDTLAGFLT